VDLWKDGRYYKKYIHRLVADAFIPNPNNLPFVNHKDEDGTNNFIDNLEWCTREYNVNYGTAKERRAKKIRGVPHTEEHKKKIRDGSTTCKKVLCIETGIIYKSIREAERQTGVNHNNIGETCSGKRKTAGKMHWKYLKSN
jgi:hypothetical protein